MNELKKSWLQPLFILLFVLAALWLLHRELAHYQLRDIESSLAALSWGQLGLATALTCLSYVVLIGYDWIGVQAIHQVVPLNRIALASGGLALPIILANLATLISGGLRGLVKK